MPVCWLFATLTSNPPLYRSPFGLPPAYLLPPHRFNVQPATLCRSLLDFLVPSLHFNVQSVPPAAPFWTSSCLPSTSTSNPSPLPHPFGLHLAYLLPPHRFNVQSTTLCRSLLDFLVPSHHSNVQSDTLSLSFWTSFCLFTGFPPLQRPTCHSMPLPFGLPRASPPLQHPILHTIALPFGLPPAYLLPSHHFSVQSAILSLSFWTSSCLLTTLTSNLPPSTLELEHPLKKHLIFRHKYIHN